MNQPNPLLKAAALASSILLVAGVVLYRMGVLTPLMEPDRSGRTGAGAAVPAASGAFAARDTPDVAPRDSEEGLAIDTALAGSGRRPRADPKDSARRNAVFFNGSKSGVPVIAPPDSAEAGGDGTVQHLRPDTTPRRQYMGGSKSLAPLIDAPVSKPTGGADSPAVTKRKP
jgi:hypothetical protein